MTDPGRAPGARTAAAVGRVTVAMIAGLTLISCGSSDEDSSPSPSSPTGATANLDTTVPDLEPIELTVNVVSDTLINPIPPRFGIELGGHDPNVSALLSVGSNQIELPGDFLADAATADGKLVVTFWDDLKEPGGLAGSSTAVVGDRKDPTLHVTVTEDGISLAGPWLQAFEISRGNPIREAECDAVSALIDESLTTLQWSELIESELESSSSLAEFREAYTKHLQLESSYLDTVLAFQPVYFSRFTELEEVLQERVELTALASEATSSGRLNGYIDSINATVDDLNRIEDNVANTWGALCR